MLRACYFQSAFSSPTTRFYIKTYFARPSRSVIIVVLAGPFVGENACFGSPLPDCGPLDLSGDHWQNMLENLP